MTLKQHFDCTSLVGFNLRTTESQRNRSTMKSSTALSHLTGSDYMGIIRLKLSAL